MPRQGDAGAKNGAGLKKFLTELGKNPWSVKSEHLLEVPLLKEIRKFVGIPRPEDKLGESVSIEADLEKIITVEEEEEAAKGKAAAEEAAEDKAAAEEEAAAKTR